MSVQPKKSLGQHFLKDPHIANQIAELVDGSQSDYVIEVGPGMGMLTAPLLARFGEKLHVIEIDRDSVGYLEQNFPELAGRIHSGDFLKMNLAELFPGQLSVVGNFPYNISSQILFHLLKAPDQVNEVCGMLQREVARRITTGPGSKEYGILSVLLDFYFDRKYHFTVSEHVFHPPPKVKSGVIRLAKKKEVYTSLDFSLLTTLVKTAFNQRRKMLRNSLSAQFPKDVLALEIFSKRPEQLALADFIRLVELFK